MVLCARTRRATWSCSRSPTFPATRRCTSTSSPRPVPVSSARTTSNEAGAALENDTRAVFLLYENSWAAPFAVAVRKAGGQIIADGRIPTQQIIAALDELAAAEAAG